MLARIRSSGLFRSTVTLTSTMAVGDVICQKIEARYAQEQRPFDARRLLAFAATGLFWNSPASYGILFFTERLSPGTAAPQVVKKIALTMLMEPARLSGILATNQLFLGNGIEDIKSKLTDGLLDAYKFSLGFYPPTLTVSIFLLSVQNRMFLLAPAGCIANSYFSFISARHSSTECAS